MSATISIITINYNNAHGLQQTLESVASQVSQPFEYLVIDGGSSDDSLGLVETYKSNITYWISEPDKGIYDAMNKGIAAAKGDYLLFLNSGDCLADSRALERCSKIMQQAPNADVYYGDMYLVNDPNHPGRNHCRFPEVLNLLFFEKDTLNHQASLIRASLFTEFSTYPEQYHMASDYWLYLTAFLHDKKFHHLPFPMVDYDFSGISSTGNDKYQKEKLAIWNRTVPLCVRNLIAENKQYKNLNNYRIVKFAIGLNRRLQQLRKKKG